MSEPSMPADKLILVTITPEMFELACEEIKTQSPPEEADFLTVNPHLIVLAWHWWWKHLRREHLMHALFDIETVTVFEDGTSSAQWLNSWSWEGVAPEDRPTYFDPGGPAGMPPRLRPMLPLEWFRIEPKRRGPHTRRPPIGPDASWRSQHRMLRK